MKIKIILILAALMMICASCSREICTNRHAYRTIEGQTAELRHGTYFRVQGRKVLQFRFENSDTWHNGNECEIKGDTIFLFSSNVESKFYYHE